jgi:hypothetical protein
LKDPHVSATSQGLDGLMYDRAGRRQIESRDDDGFRGQVHR